jgi:predicted acyltransferase
MTETISPIPILKPALSPRVNAPGVADPETGLEPSRRAAVLESAPAPAARPQRLVSLDAYRGLVMVLMVSAGLRIGQVVKNFDATPELQHLHTPLWDKLAYQTDHAPWVGCTLWDLIQPSFMFMVGAAVPFSIASRRAKGHTFGRMLVHAVIRSLVLIWLGIFLVSHGARTNWTFDVVLTQIGLGYTFLFLLAWVKPRWQVAAAIAILVACWGAFALYPAASPVADLTAVGVPSDWPRLQGFAAHWEKNANLAFRVDQWFINLFPHEPGKPFLYNQGGYTTLNFVPSLATMIFGLLAGELLRSDLRRRWKCIALLAAGAAGLAVGWALGMSGVCPVIKRIWTPSWAIYSAGWSFGVLALFYLVIDVGRWKAWAMPLVVVGMNSIAIYCVSMLLKPWFREAVQRHVGADAFKAFGSAFAPMTEAAAFLLFCWLASWWLYRQKAFLRI